MIGWRPVALAVLAAALVAITFMDVGNAAACGDAQRLLDGGRFAEARTAFVKLLDDDATHGCATKGLQAVTREQCTRARTLADLGRKDESDKEYAAIATSEPVQNDTKPCRTALEAAAQQTCVEAAAIDERVYPQKAWKAYVALLDRPDTQACATRALTRIGRARCRAARELLGGDERKTAQKELLSLATTEPLVKNVTHCAVKALNG
jgi:hypothetical protein